MRNQAMWQMSDNSIVGGEEHGKRVRRLRRSYHERAKRRAERLLREIWHMEDRWVTDKMVGHYATTPKPCSCYACGNPRRGKWAKGDLRLTRQERKHAHRSRSMPQLDA